MKLFKTMLAAILAMAMLFTALPMTAMAVATDAADTAAQADAAVTGILTYEASTAYELKQYLEKDDTKNVRRQTDGRYLVVCEPRHRGRHHIQ